MRIYILSAITFLLVLISPGATSSKLRHRVVVINPPTLYDPLPFGFQHIAVDTRNAVAYIAGQTSINQTGSIVGSTLAEQLPVVEKNLKLAMDAVGADISDIMQLMTFVKNYDPSRDLATLGPTAQRLGKPVGTLTSTPSLAFAELLVEIQAIVAVPHNVVRRLKRSSK